jgi:hypothetical protein
VARPSVALRKKCITREDCENLRAPVSMKAMRGAVLAFGVLVFCSEVRADPLAPPFTWDRAEGTEACLGEADLRAKIVGMLGEDPFSGPNAPEVHASVARQGDGLVASVHLKEAGSATETVREFQSPNGDCAALADAVSLAVTLALTTEPAPAPAPTAPPASVDPSPPLFVDRGVLVAPKPADVGPWAAVAQVVWALGALPKAEAGVGAELRYAATKHFVLALGGDYLPPASEGGQFSVSLLKARVLACAVPFGDAAFYISACGSAEGGALQVGNELATLPTAGSHPWFGAGLSARATARLGSRFIVEGGAGALVPMSRHIYATPTCPLLGFQEPAATLSLFISTGVLF